MNETTDSPSGNPSKSSCQLKIQLCASPPQLPCSPVIDRSQQTWSYSNQRFLNPISNLPNSYIHLFHFGIWNTRSQISTPLLIRFSSLLRSSENCILPTIGIQQQNEEEAPGFPKACEEKIIQRVLVDSVFCCGLALRFRPQQREPDWVQARLN